MSLALTVILTCAAIAGAYALVNWDDPRPLWLDAVPWPRLPRPRLPRRKTPPRAHGGTGDPCTGPSEPHETGARRILTRVHGWLYPATGQHSAAVLGLTFDANQGRYCHAETGPVAIPDGYGRIGEGTVMAAIECMWGRL